MLVRYREKERLLIPQSQIYARVRSGRPRSARTKLGLNCIHVSPPPIRYTASFRLHQRPSMMNKALFIWKIFQVLTPCSIKAMGLIEDSSDHGTFGLIEDTWKTNLKFNRLNSRKVDKKGGGKQYQIGKISELHARIIRRRCEVYSSLIK